MVDALPIEEGTFADRDPEMLTKIWDLGMDIFDFIHFHEWFLDIGATTYHLYGMLDRQTTLSVVLHGDEVIACIVHKEGSLVERECHMTLKPSVWTDMVGWFSWARTAYEGAGLDKIYLSMPFPNRKPAWKLRNHVFSIKDVLSEKEVELPPNTWLETNPRRSSIRIIDANYRPISDWIHPPIDANGNKPLPWVAANMHTGLFVTLTPPGHTTLKFDPSDHYPKIPQPTKYQGWQTKVNLDVVEDANLDDLDKLLEAAPEPATVDPLKNIGKGEPDIVAEMFDDLDFDLSPREDKLFQDSNLNDLDDFLS